MGQGKDKKKRKRRKMTPAEHAERHNTPMIANAFRRVSASATANTAASASASVNVNAAPSNEGTPESLATGVSASANSAIASMTNSANATAAAGSHDESEDELMSNLNATTIRGNPPIQCHDLGKPPDPKDIADIFSPVLGDVFHAMDRPKVPIKHEAKKITLLHFKMHSSCGTKN